MGALTLSGPGSEGIVILAPSDFLRLYDWTQSTPGNGPVIETLGLRIRGDSTDEVAELLQSLDHMMLLTRQYFEGNDYSPVWLNAQLDDETHARRSLVYNITGGPNRTMMDVIFEKTHRLNDYTLAIERAPYWEDDSGTQVYHVEEAAHTFNLDATVYGDVPARISDMSIGAHDDARWSEFWMGFRSDRFGDRTNFHPAVWLTSSYVREDTSISGTSAVCNFSGTESMAERVYIRLANWTSNERDYRGEFQVLVVASVGSGMTVDLRMRHGYYADNEFNSWITHDNRVRITSTEQLVLDMGVVRFPFGRGVNSNAFMQGQAIGFDAELIGGSGNLTIHKVLLIPRSEGFIYVKAGAADDADAPSIGNGYAKVMTHPEGAIEGVLIDDNAVPEMDLELSQNKWSLPRGDVKVCWVGCATEDNGGYDVDETISFGITYNQRWRTLKGTGLGDTQG